MTDAVKRKAGRPKGSSNAITLNKTRFFQQCFTEEKVKEVADRLYEVMISKQTTDSDFIKAFSAWSRYILVTSDIEMQVEGEKAKSLSPEQIEQMKSFMEAIK